jgi:hypothetical protein
VGWLAEADKSNIAFMETILDSVCRARGEPSR